MWFMKKKCVNKCLLSPCRTYCTGCKRTIEEIKEAGKRKGEGK